MSITIRPSDDEERRLAERSARSGLALAPFRRQVEERGLSDDDLRGGLEI
jgi:hypothetical protein